MSLITLNGAALAHNIAYFKQRIGDAALACVVKANAYGHGLQQIVELTRHNTAIAYYATATLTEALYVREQTAEHKILVMADIDADPVLAAYHAIDLVLHTYEDIARYAAAAERAGRILRVHIKIDTGLARLGFFPQELAQVVDAVARYPLLQIQGLMSHCASADSSDATYTYAQIAQFNACIDLLYERGLQVPYMHMHATAAVLKYGMQRTNMARIGAGVYGMFAGVHGLQLQQVLSFTASVIAVRSVPIGTLVGYGGTYCAQRPTRLAIIPVGYAHGYQRRASNRAYVRVGNTYAPIVARVAMNSTTVDVTDCPDVVVGSQLMLLGDYPRIRLHEFAATIGSFNPREVAVGLSPLLPRVVYTPADIVTTSRIQNNNIKICRQLVY